MDTEEIQILFVFNKTYRITLRKIYLVRNVIMSPDFLLKSHIFAAVVPARSLLWYSG
jgi:hypothetical protein